MSYIHKQLYLKNIYHSLISAGLSSVYRAIHQYDEFIWSKLYLMTRLISPVDVALVICPVMFRIDMRYKTIFARWRWISLQFIWCVFMFLHTLQNLCPASRFIHKALYRCSALPMLFTPVYLLGQRTYSECLLNLKEWGYSDLQMGNPLYIFISSWQKTEDIDLC